EAGIVSHDHDAGGFENAIQLRDQLVFCRSIHLLSPLAGFRPGPVRPERRGFAPPLGRPSGRRLRLAATPLRLKAQGDATLLMPCPLVSAPLKSEHATKVFEVRTVAGLPP